MKKEYESNGYKAGRSNVNKILYVTITLSNGWEGGEPIVAKKTIKSLEKIGYTVTKAFYKSKLGGLFTGVTVLLRSYFCTSDSFLFSYKYYKRIIKRENPDVIIAQYDYDNSVVKAAVKQRKKIIVYVHMWWPTCPKITLFTHNGQVCRGYTGNDCKTCILSEIKPKSIVDKGYKTFLSFLTTNSRINKKMKNKIDLLNKENVIVAVLSPYMRDYFIRNGISQDKIKIVPNSVSCKEFSPSSAPRERLVGYYGGENILKGYGIFFRIAEIIKKTYPDFRFVATGEFKIKTPYVDFVGTLDRKELSQLMAKSRCTVIPSIWDEPFPAVTLESMAGGTPVVTFDVGFLKSIIQNGVSGFIVPLMAIDEMVVKIIKIITDDELFTKLSKNGRRIACEEFTEDKRITLIKQMIETS